MVRLLNKVSLRNCPSVWRVPAETALAKRLEPAGRAFPLRLAVGFGLLRVKRAKGVPDLPGFLTNVEILSFLNAV